MCIGRFASRALRLTWSLNAHPSTHHPPLYSPPLPSSSSPPPTLVICLFWGGCSAPPRASLCLRTKRWNLRKSTGFYKKLRCRLDPPYPGSPFLSIKHTLTTLSPHSTRDAASQSDPVICQTSRLYLHRALRRFLLYSDAGANKPAPISVRVSRR